MSDLDSRPMLSARQSTQFFKDLTDQAHRINVGGTLMPLGVWNMIVTHRDLKMWCDRGMKPHRGWKVSDVKTYFGIKGSKQKLLREFEALKAEVNEALGISND